MTTKRNSPPKKDAHLYLPENAIGHVLYEILMLLEGIRRQQSTEFPDAFYKNAAIESFAVHARNLDEFFRGTGDRDSIKPGVFGFPDTVGVHPLPYKTRLRLNAEISHLGFKRKARGESRPWTFAAAAYPLKAHCTKFIAHVLTQLHLLSEETQRSCASIQKKIDEINWPDESALIESGGEQKWTASIPQPISRLSRALPKSGNNMTTGTSSPETFSL